MHILNIIQCTNLGGMEQSNLLEIKGLQARGHHIRLVSLNPLGELAPELESAGIPSTGLLYRGRLGWRSFFAMRRSFRASNADAVLMTGHNLVAMLALVGFGANRRVMAIHYHHFENSQYRWRWWMFYSLAARVFDHVTFVSGFIRDEALEILPHLESMSSVVPSPFLLPEMPTDGARRTARAALDLPEDACVVGNAGWLIPRKRFDVFLRVAARVIAIRPDTVFLVAGEGPERGRLTDLACELGVERHVRFIGWCADLGDFFKSLDVLLFNSDFDALGRTPAEAASYGVPVVGSVIEGGLPELFRSNEEAILLREHDVDKLSEAVLRLLSNTEERSRLAECGRTRVAEYGDIEEHVATFERLLNSDGTQGRND